MTRPTISFDEKNKLFFNTNPEGNYIYLLRADDKDNKLANKIKLCVDDIKNVFMLLDVEVSSEDDTYNLSIDTITNEDGRELRLITNSAHSKPYPAIIIASAVIDVNKSLILHDVRDEDAAAIPYVRTKYMTSDKPVYNLPFIINPEWNGENSDLLVEIADEMESGVVFMQNLHIANFLYQIAAAANNPIALNNLGYRYQMGYVVDKNVAKAIELYEKAAELGNTTAMVNLGNIYEFGELDGEPNYELAHDWYKRAADDGDLKGLFNYANCLHYGYGVEQDCLRALELYRCLADNGYESAYFYLGLYHQKGIGTEVDYEAARHYYRLGALADDKYCYNQLGIIYGLGLGVKKDVHAAHDYYMEAAKLGDALGYLNVGWFYENGDLGEVNNAEALKYYKLAMDAGVENAEECYHNLKNRIDTEKVDKLKNLKTINAQMELYEEMSEDDSSEKSLNNLS